MDSRAKALGHSIHQQLIVFPLGLLVTSVVFDVLARALDRDELSTAAHWMVAAGVVTGVLAAVFGTLDYLAIPKGTRARRVGLAHGAGNDLLLVLFAASWLLRDDDPAHRAPALALALAVAGLLLAGVTGWLGGELVSRLGVGVHDDAHLDAPADLTTGISLRPATEPPS